MLGAAASLRRTLREYSIEPRAEKTPLNCNGARVSPRDHWAGNALPY
jgi:hypothetical protein